ncbi:undecaprenyl-diphosphate phosphatase [Microlunatus flavus]|uniref:Undecaprenyl-diphosphatase n=1 Tax=Microlunatus flavus TaxID=1036181 RepID=A0A1H8ZJV0_9ACTN|nr:undecaprenyl-diphosphate phosphatase [Microlunatus flavus]SEP64601.1 undecaprenyl-diphosphatase [Microlunatus flavus]
MNFWEALLLGVVEGITEFLPVSSTGHLTIVEKLLGLRIDDAGVTAFTAVIQVGAIIASIVYFRADIVRLAGAWFRGLVNAGARQERDWKMAWLVIAGSIPIGIVGLLLSDLITGPLRSLWFVVGGLLVWSVVMVLAERLGRQDRSESDLTLVDALVVGVVQCLALVPGVSRSGATISAGLLRGLDRVSATRLAFFLAIPALTAAGVYEAVGSADDIATSVGWGPTAVATVVSFVVGFASIAWLLRIVAKFPITVFVGYRVVLAVVIAVLLLTGVVSAT